MCKEMLRLDMKRILIIIATLFVTVGASAQIQKNFFGLELGKEYDSNLRLLCYDLEKYCTRVKTGRDKITLHDVKFGGYTWTFACLNFEGQENRTLVAATFFKASYDMEEIAADAATLIVKLAEKYGDVADRDVKDDVYLSWLSDDARNKCELRVAQKGNSLALSLFYVDVDALRRTQQRQMDEL